MSDLKLTGAIHKVFELTPISDSFMKQEFILLVEDGQYPQHVKFECTQSQTDILQKVKVGDNVTVHFNVRGRKWDSPTGETKYFNTLNAWRIETHAASNEAVAKDNDWPSDDDTPF